MEAIIRLISNPEWWFTAIFISIFTGVFAGYAKDWLTRVLSFGSERIRQRNLKAKLERQKKISCYLEDPVLLLIAYQEITHLICFFVLFILFSLVFPVYSAISTSISEVNASSSILEMSFAAHIRKEISAFMSVASASMAIIVEMKAIGRIRDCRKVARLLKKQAVDKLSKKGVLNLLP